LFFYFLSSDQNRYRVRSGERKRERERSFFIMTFDSTCQARPQGRDEGLFIEGASKSKSKPKATYPNHVQNGSSAEDKKAGVGERERERERGEAIICYMCDVKVYHIVCTRSQ
jgi:hypothetical protein